MRSVAKCVRGCVGSTPTAQTRQARHADLYRRHLTAPKPHGREKEQQLGYRIGLPTQQIAARLPPFLAKDDVLRGHHRATAYRISAIGLTGCRIPPPNKSRPGYLPAQQRTTLLSDNLHRAIGLPGHRIAAMRLSGYRATGYPLSGYRATGYRHQTDHSPATPLPNNARRFSRIITIRLSGYRATG